MGRHPWNFSNTNRVYFWNAMKHGLYLQINWWISIKRTNRIDTPTGLTLRSKVLRISKIETAVHSDSPTKLSILSFQDLPFCTFPTDTTPHFSKKSPVDVWQVCTTVLDFSFAKNIDQETAHKDIQRHQAPETSIISEEWRWVKMTRKVDW